MKCIPSGWLCGVMNWQNWKIHMKFHRAFLTIQVKRPLMKKSQSSVVKQMESMRTHIVELVNLPETETPLISAYLDLLENQDYLRSKLSYLPDEID